jgi:hypothetical protein
VVTRSVAAISAAVARTNWRSSRPTTCPYVKETPRREAVRIGAIGRIGHRRRLRGAGGLCPGLLDAPRGGSGIILHLGAVGYRLLRTIFTSDNVALISITSTSQPAHGQKGAGGKSRPVVHAGGSGRFSVQPACSDQDHQHHERQQHANDECDNDYGAVTFHGTCASDSVLGFRGHRYPTARWCWWLVPARLLAANSVAGRGAHPRLASARNNLYGLM